MAQSTRMRCSNVALGAVYENRGLFDPKNRSMEWVPVRAIRWDKQLEFETKAKNEITVRDERTEPLVWRRSSPMSMQYILVHVLARLSTGRL